MDRKKFIYLGIFVGSTIGGLIGAAFDRGNGLGFWSLFLGTVGSFVGIWGAYKISS